MATWDVSVPAIGEAANTIHTLIQSAKASISDLLAASNGTIDMHNLCKADEDGLHTISKVGFVRVSTWANRLTTGLVLGSLHYITDAPNAGIYLVEDDASFTRINAVDHEQLIDLIDDSCHLDLFNRDGSNSMAVELRVQTGVTISGHVHETDDDSDSLDPDHQDLEWYVAHGEDAIVSRHFADSEIRSYDMDIVFYAFPILYTYFDQEATNRLYGWPVGWGGTNPPVTDYIWGTAIVGGKSRVSAGTGNTKANQTYFLEDPDA